MNTEEIAAVPGWLSQDEGRKLAELAALVPAEDAIVEIGSYIGKSTAWLLSGEPVAPIVCIDPWDELYTAEYSDASSDDQLSGFLGTVAWFAGTAKVLPLRSTSLDVAATWVRPVGLLFVDATHDYDNVTADFEAWFPKMRQPGGYMVFHDYSAAWPGVKKALDKIGPPDETVDSLWIWRVT